MRVLVVGGTGILGRAIVRAIRNAGIVHTVSVALAQPEQWDSGVLGRVVVADRTSPDIGETLAKCSGGMQFDWVVDVVCYDAETVNAIVRAPCCLKASFVMLSTTYLYDEHRAMPHREDDPLAPTVQLGGYAVGKLEAEVRYQQLCAQDGRPVTILRLPHVVGGHELGIVPLHNRDSMLIARLSRGKVLGLVCGGMQAVQIIAPGDVGAAVARILGDRTPTTGVFNCAHPTVITARQYYCMIADTIGVEARIVDVPLGPFIRSGWGWERSAVSRLVDTKRMMQRFGFVPSIGPREALETATRALLEAMPDGEEGEVDTSLDSLLAHMGDGNEAQWALSAVAAGAERQGIDARMNRPPLPRVRV